MSVSTTAIATTKLAAKPKKTGRRLLLSPTVVLSVIWIVGLLLASVTGPLWLNYGPLEQDLSAVLQGPTAAHLLGTDELGRDLLSRIVTAAAPTIGLALIAPLVGVGLTLPLTLWAVRSRRGEIVANNVAEIVLSLPSMVIILAVIAAIGTNMPVVMAVLGVLFFGALFRIFAGQAKSLQRQLYVEAATVDGVRPFITSIRHVLPNMLTTVVVQFVIFFGVGIMIQAGLAFIGLGPQPPEPTWGGMIQTASRFIFQQPWMMVPTGVVLAITIIAANALGDVLGGGASTPPPLVAIRRRRRGDAAVEAPATATPAAATPAAENELIVEDLVIGVDDGPELVTGISMRVKPGRVMGLVGESGCGKSVTSYALLGLLAPGLSVRSGRIQWGATDLSRADEKSLAKVRGHEIAFISQEPTRALDPMFTIESQLVSAIKRLRGVKAREAKAIAEKLLVDVGIVDAPRVLSSFPHQISGGMAQRVAIALALSGEPKLLIADEPTTALDVTVQAEILDLLRGLIAERDMSIIFVTHDLGVVADLCDDVSVMYAGEIVETGSVSDVLLHPEHPYTMALLAADPHAIIDFEGMTRLASIPGQVPQPGSWTGGCRFAKRCRFATEECLFDVELEPRVVGTGGVRCVRRDEVQGRQEEWRQPVTEGAAR